MVSTSGTVHKTEHLLSKTPISPPDGRVNDESTLVFSVGPHGEVQLHYLWNMKSDNNHYKLRTKAQDNTTVVPRLFTSSRFSCDVVCSILIFWMTQGTCKSLRREEHESMRKDKHSWAQATSVTNSCMSAMLSRSPETDFDESSTLTAHQWAHVYVPNHRKSQSVRGFSPICLMNSCTSCRLVGAWAQEAEHGRVCASWGSDLDLYSFSINLGDYTNLHISLGAMI